MRCGAISGRPAGVAKARRPQYFRFTEIDNGVECRHDFDGRGARPAAFACNSAPRAAIERLRGASGGVVLTDAWFSRDERKNKNRTYARLLQEVVGFSGNPNSARPIRRGRRERAGRGSQTTTGYGLNTSGSGGPTDPTSSGARGGWYGRQ